jgi:hypothetical protein
MEGKQLHTDLVYQQITMIETNAFRHFISRLETNLLDPDSDSIDGSISYCILKLSHVFGLRSKLGNRAHR